MRRFLTPEIVMINPLRAALLLATLTGSTPLLAQTYVYVSEAGDGTIARYSLDQHGALHLLGHTPAEGKVMPLALSTDKTHLYAAIRSKPLQLASWVIDRRSGDLTQKQQVPAAASYPWIVAEPQGRFLLAASYDGNVVDVYRLTPEATLSAPPVSRYATGPAAHSAIADPAGKTVYVGNLGTDRVLQLTLSDSGTLAALGSGYAATAKNNGPRHSVMSADGRFLYNIGEMGGVITQFRREANGALVKVAESPSAVAASYHLAEGRERPPGYSDPTPRIWAADIHLTPDGRFLYVSERTSITLSGYRVDAESGALTLAGSWPVEKQPRGFAITPDGRGLVVSGEKSAVIGSYRIDPQSGALTRTGEAPVGSDANWVTIVHY